MSRPSRWEFRLSPLGAYPARLALVVVLVLVFTTSLASTAPAEDLGWVRSYIRLNVRSGAGTQFKILGGVETGDELKILSRGESWTRVQTKDGNIGWTDPDGNEQ